MGSKIKNTELWVQKGMEHLHRVVEWKKDSLQLKDVLKHTAESLGLDSMS